MTRAPDDQILPDVLSGMDTAPGITDEERHRKLLDDAVIEVLEKCEYAVGKLRRGALGYGDGEKELNGRDNLVSDIRYALAAMRAVASRADEHWTP